MKVLVSILTLFLLFSCGSEEEKTPQPDVFEIRNMGTLSTTEYTIGKVIKLDDVPEEWYKYGDRKLLISCKAKVKAGVDLTQVEEDDVRVRGNSIEIILPPAEITSFVMDPNYVRTEMESITGFRDNFTQTEKRDFLEQGEQAILEDLKETEIIADAERNASIVLTQFYENLGFEEVTIKHKPRNMDALKSSNQSEK